MNITISCIFTAFQGSCANLNFIKLAGFFCISPTSCLLAKRKTKVCALLWIWQTLTFSPGIPMAPWGPGSPCRQEGEFFFFFLFFPMMFLFQLVSETQKSHFIHTTFNATNLSTGVALLSWRSWLSLRSLRGCFWRNLVTNTRIDYSISSSQKLGNDSLPVKYCRART